MNDTATFNDCTKVQFSILKCSKVGTEFLKLVLASIETIAKICKILFQLSFFFIPVNIVYANDKVRCVACLTVFRLLKS